MNNGIVQFLAQSPMKVVVIDVELRVAVCKNDGSDKQRSGSAVAVLTFVPELPFQFVERYSAYTASMLADRAQASQGKRKVPKLIPASLRRSCQKTALGERPAGKMDSEIKLLIQEAANRRISLCTLMTQSPKAIQGRASLSNKVQPSSMKTLEVETVTYMPSAGLL